MRYDQPFMRCKGKDVAFIKAAEAAGDMSHSEKKHVCDACRCKRIAGSGTRGDFYGLGPETGMYGVGMCNTCASRMSPGLVAKHARRQLECIQAYGVDVKSRDSEYGLKVMEAETAMAVQKQEVRQELSIVQNELKRIQKTMEDDTFTEMTREGPMPAADKTKAMLVLEFAKVISKLNLDHYKLNENDYVHVDEVTQRLMEMVEIGRQCISKAIEMTIAKQVRGEEIETDRPVQEYVGEMFLQQMVKLWDKGSIKTGRKR